MVTAELAIGILSATIVAAILAWVVAIAGLQIRCGDSAAQIARQTARGDQGALQRARAAAPEGSAINVETAGPDVIVTVSAEARWGVVGPFSVSGSSQVSKEPGVVTET